MSLFADDTNIFCADLASVEKALKLIEEFGKIADLCLNVKKTKANNTKMGNGQIIRATHLE